MSGEIRLTLDKDKLPDNRLFCRSFTPSLIEIWLITNDEAKKDGNFALKNHFVLAECKSTVDFTNSFW